LFAVVPAGILFVTSFFPKPSGEYYSVGFTTTHYVRILEGQALEYITTTLSLAVITTLLCLLIGFPMAYGLSRFCSPKYKRNYLIVIIATMWLTVIIRTYAIQILYATDGMFNRLLVWLGFVPEAIFESTGLVTVLTGMVYGYLPFALLTMYSSINKIEPSIEEASLNLGANRLQTIWRVIIPQAIQGIAVAGGLVFILSSGSYVIPRLLGDPSQWTVPILITQQISNQLNVPYAAALAIVFVFVIDGIFMISFWAYRRLGSVSVADLGIESLSSKFVRVGDSILGYVPNSFTSRVPMLLRAYLLVLLVLFALPLAVVISVSFSPGSVMQFPPEGFSLQWYEEILTAALWRNALVDSMFIAVIAAVISTSIGASLAYSIDRFELEYKSQLMALGVTPLVIPPVIAGVAYMSYFLQIGIWGTKYGVAIAHGVVFSPFALVLVKKGLDELDDHLEEAASSLGASQVQLTRTVTVPLLSSALFSGALFAFVLSLNEYIIAYFISGFGFNTVPIEIFSSLRYNYSPEIAAISVIYIMITTIVVVVVDRRFDLSLWS
jgi:putative spermidine/putrescine transport system permease protein